MYKNVEKCDYKKASISRSRARDEFCPLFFNKLIIMTDVYFVIACGAWRWIEFAKRDGRHTATQ